jgi:hypothetical protein
LDSTSLLRIGGSYSVTLSNLARAVAVAAIAGGFSTSNWQFGSLPAQLAPFGMTGCTLYVRPDVVVFLPVLAAQSTLTLAVPPVTALVGVRFHQQSLVLEPGVNPAGAIVSNAIGLSVGP